MLRKLAVWFCCCIAEILLRFYCFPDFPQGKIFMESYLIVTIGMFIWLSIKLEIDDFKIDDDYEYQKRADEVDNSRWDILWVILLIVITHIGTILFGADKYLVYQALTFGYCIGQETKSKPMDEWECEDETEESEENGKNEEQKQ